MVLNWSIFLFILVWINSPGTDALPTKPHIVFIVADDLGYNDVGWNNKDILTPNMDNLAKNGVILDQNYVYPLCSPSRVAFMTGRYPHKLGLQHRIIGGNQPNFVPLAYDMIPKKLKEQGYHTHMIGKWHLGFCNESVTPTERGFDSFFGFYHGGENYYTYRAGPYYDFRWNKQAFYPPTNGYKSYATFADAQRAEELLDDHNKNHADEPMFLYLAFQAPHEPLSVPDMYKNQINSNVTDNNRRIFSGMVLALDEAIGKVVDKMNQTGMLDNALIVFTSDNGGTPTGGGSNYPLRGTKGTYWEGGIRVPGFVYSKTLLAKSKYTTKKMVHATDWYATFLNLAGGNAASEGIDGIDQWNMLSKNGTQARDHFVINFDHHDVPFNGIRYGNFKLMMGGPGHNHDVVPVPSRKRRSMTEKSKRQRTHAYLFDLDANPSEDPNQNLFLDDNFFSIKRSLRTQMNALMTQMKNAYYPAEVPDLAAAAANKDNGYWAPGWCDAF